MKITNELRDRINREVTEKHQPELTTIADKCNADLEVKVKELIEEVTAVLEAHPNLKPLLQGRTIEQCVRYHLIPHTTNQARSAAMSVVNSKIKTEVENIIITISYGKTIEDVKTAFATYGLSF